MRNPSAHPSLRFALLAALLSTSTFADTQTAIPLAGRTCPTGYYKSGNYCVARNEHSKAAMQAVGVSCPSGYYKSGQYCVARKENTPAAIERQGVTCPTGYYKSGAYCVKSH